MYNIEGEGRKLFNVLARQNVDLVYTHIIEGECGKLFKVLVRQNVDLISANIKHHVLNSM